MQFQKFQRLIKISKEVCRLFLVPKKFVSKISFSASTEKLKKIFKIVICCQKWHFSHKNQFSLFYLKWHFSICREDI